MNPLTAFLERQGVMILDGGLATELERRGADLPDALWSARLLLDGPELIRDVHRAYFEAGADVVATASYQASVGGFAKRGLGPAEARGAIRRSVELARDARERFWAGPGRGADRLWPLVAGSVGPYGAALADGSEYRGQYGVSPAALADFHRPRLEELAAAGVDLFALETFPSAEEARIVLGLLEEWPGLGAWVSFSARDAAHVGDGQPIEAAARMVADHAQVAAIGVNCLAPALVDELLSRLGGVTEKPLLAYPNSGETWDAVARCWTGGVAALDPAMDAPRWYGLGARLIGGCCRTTPETITALRRVLLRQRTDRGGI
jgi:homocysteine S-methyltransferase